MITRAWRTAMPMLAIACAGAAQAAASSPCARLRDQTSYLTFCSIPKTPIDVRTPAEFHTAVLDTRLAGRAMVQENAARPFTLQDTEGFLAEARTAVTPPPTPPRPGPQDTAAFARDARARATPPRPR